jgi:hypothetical protein
MRFSSSYQPKHRPATHAAVTPQPDSMVPSAPVNSAPNMPPPAMPQDLYSASIEMNMQRRRAQLSAGGAMNGRPWTVNIPGKPVDEQ